jgi:dihydrofolate reductase
MSGRGPPADSDGPALHICGSSELLQTLIAAELVDEYRIRVYPLVLGEGKRLFENGVSPRSLALVETRSTPSPHQHIPACRSPSGVN